jgi:hypothetical protein
MLFNRRIVTVATGTKFAGRRDAAKIGSAKTGARVSFSVCNSTEVNRDGNPASAVARSATIKEPWPSLTPPSGKEPPLSISDSSKRKPAKIAGGTGSTLCSFGRSHSAKSDASASTAPDDTNSCVKSSSNFLVTRARFVHGFSRFSRSSGAF